MPNPNITNLTEHISKINGRGGCVKDARGVRIAMMNLLSLSRAGTTRLTICFGPFALKLARGRQGLICNRFEADVWKLAPEFRRAMLCPVLWKLPFGIGLLMPRAVPLTESEHATMKQPDWDYVPPDIGHPFEPKASDWGWLKGRLVALDYSATAESESPSDMRREGF
jgi:hypothetical protein